MIVHDTFIIKYSVIPRHLVPLGIIPMYLVPGKYEEFHYGRRQGVVEYEDDVLEIIIMVAASGSI